MAAPTLLNHMSKSVRIFTGSHSTITALSKRVQCVFHGGERARQILAFLIRRIDEHAAAPLGRRQQRAQAGEAVGAFDARAVASFQRLAQVPGLFALGFEKHRAIHGPQRAGGEQR